MIKKTKTSAVAILMFGLTSLFAQLSTNSALSQIKWVSDVINEKVYIKNLGQFDKYKSSLNEKVLYGFEKNGFRALFRPDGVTYNIETSLNDTATTPESKTELVTLTWVGCNKNVQINAEQKSEEYFNYNLGDVSKNINYAPGYGSITYKDLYNGIDLQFSFYPDKKGFKYSFIVHPGADPSQIAIEYKGASLSINDKGHLNISTDYNLITDHTPETYYEHDKQIIKSEFEVKNNVVHFAINHYENNKTIIIDPWVTNPNLSTVNKAWSIERDAIGNIYVLGGQNPKVLRKYAGNGSAQWTTAVITGFGNAHTSHATNNSGISYVSNPIASNAQIFKITSSGTIIVSNTSANSNITPPPLFGVYKLCFNKTKTELIAGSVTAGNSIARVDTGTCFLYSVNTHTGSSEVRDICSSDNGKFYCLTVQTNTIFFSKLFEIFIANNGSLTPTWALASGYNYNQFGYAANQSIGLGGMGPRNAIAASKCFVYTYNSETLYKRNIALNGALVSSITVVGGTIKNNAGVIVDSCDNVYVGTMQGVSKYNSSNNSFNLIGSVTTPSAVLDMEFGNNYEIYVCGPGMVASVSGIYNQCQAPLTVNYTSKPATCGQNNGWINVNSVSGGIPTYSYTWSNGATTPSIGNLSPGTYTLKIVDNSCSLRSFYKEITIAGPPSPTVGISSFTNIICNGNNTGAIISNVSGGTAPITYQWLPGNQNNSSLSNVGAGNYTVIVTDAYSCTSTSTISITQPPAYSITVSSNSILCNGNSNGSASIAVNGGIPPYTYLWSNGSTINSINSVGAGTYTCVVSDQAGCKNTQTIDIAQPNPLAMSINSFPQQVCAGSSVNIIAFTQGGTPPYSYICNGNTSNGTVTTIHNISGSYEYSFTCVDANLCSISYSRSVLFNKLPIISSSNSTLCSGSKTQLTAFGADTYKWLPSEDWGNNIIVSPQVSTSYTIIGKDNLTGCNSLPYVVNIKVNPLPTLTIISDKENGCEPLSVNLEAISSSSIIACTWGFDLENKFINKLNVEGSFTSSGTHTIITTITDQNGCANSAHKTVTVYPKPYAHTRIINELNTESSIAEFDNLSSPDATKWFWDFGDGLTSTEFEPTHTYLDEPRIYKVFLVATTDHECSDTTMTEVKVNHTNNIFVPNTFTPNNDGLNDTFSAKGTPVKEFKLVIFNRWGTKLFESVNMNEGWDGSYKGEEVEQDTYTWLINYISEKGKSQTLIGNVNLLK